eukprot:augustus_masked-scaffold_31-processed-gene-0.44-mRNA-1 protein AED:1.00 eAED:1.00 QI:0/-1/0/0/-1/1/1/0/601
MNVALLSQIEKGTELKKSETKDNSQALVPGSKKKANTGPSSGGLLGELQNRQRGLRSVTEASSSLGGKTKTPTKRAVSTKPTVSNANPMRQKREYSFDCDDPPPPPPEPPSFDAFTAASEFLKNPKVLTQVHQEQTKLSHHCYSENPPLKQNNCPAKSSNQDSVSTGYSGLAANSTSKGRSRKKPPENIPPAAECVHPYYSKYMDDSQPLENQEVAQEDYSEEFVHPYYAKYGASKFQDPIPEIRKQEPTFGPSDAQIDHYTEHGANFAHPYYQKYGTRSQPRAQGQEEDFLESGSACSSEREQMELRYREQDDAIVSKYYSKYVPSLSQGTQQLDVKRKRRSIKKRTSSLKLVKSITSRNPLHKERKSTLKNVAPQSIGKNIVYFLVKALEAKSAKYVSKLFMQTVNKQSLEAVLEFAQTSDDLEGFLQATVKYDVHILAGCLKSYFRTHVPPHFSTKKYKEIVTCCKKEGEDIEKILKRLKKIDMFRQKEDLLLKELGLLFSFLFEIESVDASLMGYVWAPTLLKPSLKEMELALTYTKNAVEVTKTMIVYSDILFPQFVQLVAQKANNTKGPYAEQQITKETSQRRTGDDYFDIEYSL